MYGAPPVCLNQSPGHPVQCAAIASQPAQSEGQGRGAPGSVSASHVLAATPFPKPWCLNVLLCGGGGGPSFKWPQYSVCYVVTGDWELRPYKSPRPLI